MSIDPKYLNLKWKLCADRKTDRWFIKATYVKQGWSSKLVDVFLCSTYDFDAHERALETWRHLHQWTKDKDNRPDMKTFVYPRLQENPKNYNDVRFGSKVQAMEIWEKFKREVILQLRATTVDLEVIADLTIE